MGLLPVKTRNNTCPYDLRSRTRSSMLKHLVTIHQLDKAEATTLIDQRAQFLTKNPDIQVRKPGEGRGSKRKLVEDD
ncbi:hypothetical protein GJ744_007284 [Endocarpon pusillum]|uniref:Uncharacterized protein n=1 Tax=Endocarpon pusillum TaxID=364733 RepID=A0A8H7AIZ1_9EURO|nr:hypothetical protein GJ744_007284 [Endocarpon pusillum]